MSLSEAMTIPFDVAVELLKAKAALGRPAGENGVKKFREASLDEVRAFLDRV